MSNVAETTSQPGVHAAESIVGTVLAWSDGKNHGAVRQSTDDLIPVLAQIARDVQDLKHRVDLAEGALKSDYFSMCNGGVYNEQHWAKNCHCFPGTKLGIVPLCEVCIREMGGINGALEYLVDVCHLQSDLVDGAAKRLWDYTSGGKYSMSPGLRKDCYDRYTESLFAPWCWVAVGLTEEAYNEREMAAIND